MSHAPPADRGARVAGRAVEPPARPLRLAVACALPPFDLARAAAALRGAVRRPCLRGACARGDAARAHRLRGGLAPRRARHGHRLHRLCPRACPPRLPLRPLFARSLVAAPARSHDRSRQSPPTAPTSEAAREGLGAARRGDHDRCRRAKGHIRAAARRTLEQRLELCLARRRHERLACHDGGIRAAPLQGSGALRRDRSEFPHSLAERCGGAPHHDGRRHPGRCAPHRATALAASARRRWRYLSAISKGSPL